MSQKLDGKIAVVTGGSAGIGLAAAERFAREGARVFITGRDKDRLDRAVARIGHDAVGIEADASNLAGIDRIYETVKMRAGRVDVLLVNAGFCEFGRFGEITEERRSNERDHTAQRLLGDVAEPASSETDGVEVRRPRRRHV